MNPLRITAIMLGVASALSCFEPAAPTWVPAEQAAGEWQWVRSVDVRTGASHTPENAGFAATLRITAASPLSGAYTYARTGSPLIEGSFTIGAEDAPGNDFITIDTPIDFLSRNAWIATGPDTLRLDGVFELGFNTTYARKK